MEQFWLNEGYAREEELTWSDCDRNQTMRIGAIATKAALYGGYDYDQRGWPREKLLALGQVFLLSRMAFRIHRNPKNKERLTTRTWEKGVKGPHMQRVYLVTDEAGALCIAMRSDWILVNPTDRKILRPSAFTACPTGNYDGFIDCPETMKIVLPKEKLEDLGERKVVWSDLDGNGHLFSGKYGDIVWDAMPEDLQCRTPREFFLNYNREATLGQTIRMQGCRKENTYCMEGAGPNGVCFTAMAVFDE